MGFALSHGFVSKPSAVGINLKSVRGNRTGEACARDLLTSLSLLPLAWGPRPGFEEQGRLWGDLAGL